MPVTVQLTCPCGLSGQAYICYQRGPSPLDTVHAKFTVLGIILSFNRRLNCVQKPLIGGNKKTVDDDEALLTLRSGHDVMMSVLVSRHRNLQVVKAMWSAGNVRVSLKPASC